MNQVDDTRASDVEIISDANDDETLDDETDNEGVVGSRLSNLSLAYTPPSTPPQTTFELPPESGPSTKRSASERTPTSSPSASPVKKRERLQVNSAIRNALELTTESGKPSYGLLQFFSKGTKEDVNEYWHREEEKRQDEEAELVFNARSLTIEKKDHEKELSRLQQQKRRAKVKTEEILAGKRSPRGTKRKVG